MNCDDPRQSYPTVNGQIPFAWGDFKSAGNDMSYGRRPSSDQPGADASATYETGDRYGTHHTTFYDGWTMLEGDWGSYSGYAPWHWRTGTIIHEFMHTMGYKHMDSESSQQACADRNDRATYYERGQPSLPYIYDNCARKLVMASYDQCGAESLRGDCPVGHMKLLQNWQGTYSTVQTAGPETGVCVQDPRHLIALKSISNNRYVTAVNGGGGATSTTASTVGAWQFFHALDVRPAQGPGEGKLWWGYDPVFLKAFNGDYLRQGSDGTYTTYRTDGDAPSTCTCASCGDSGAIENGQRRHPPRRHRLCPQRPQHPRLELQPRAQRQPLSLPCRSAAP